MNRRRLLAGIAGVTLTGGSVWVATGGVSSGDGLPVEVETMRARGSEDGTVRVPEPGTVTVVDLFATWCAPCTKQMDALTRVFEEYGDEAVFVSVTNERLGGTLSRADIREWWREHDGRWTLGLDPESALMTAFGADGLPYLAVVAGDGTVTWTHSGVASAETLRSEIGAALDR